MIMLVYITIIFPHTAPIAVLRNATNVLQVYAWVNKYICNPSTKQIGFPTDAIIIS